MVGILIILAFILSVLGMILAFSKLRIHPFVIILGASLALGLAAGIPIASIPGLLGAGFSSIFSSVGMLVIFGILIGAMLDASGGAMKIADMVVRLIGKRSPTLAFMLMGWVVSISVYCEPGFVLLNPARKSAARHAGTGGVATAMGLGSGLLISHALVPLTPGPLAAAAALGLGGSLPLVMLAAAAASIPALAGAYFFAIYIGKKKKSKEDHRVAKAETLTSYGRLLRKRKLPNGLLSVMPILAPILLIALGSTAAAAGWAGVGGSVAAFAGSPLIAMIAGLFFAVALLARTKKMKEFNPATESALKTAGPILCTMGAGGVLGHIIMGSGVVEFVMHNAAALRGMGLLFPFLIAAAIKTAQGSTTVAMIAAAAITAPLAGALGLDSEAALALAVMAIGAGSMVASHVNDPYFWIVVKLSGMSPRQGYASHTAITLVAGLCCMAGVFAFSLFVR